MKRRLLALLLAVLTLTMLTAAVFAEDATAKGAYNLSAKKNYTLTPDRTNDGSGFYAGASQFTLACKELTGEFSLVLLLDETKGVTAIPTESNLQYIDQVDIKKGKATFSIIPKAMTDGATYNVYVSTNGENGSLTKVASFQYGTKPPYTLGDVDNDGQFTATDSMYALQMAVGLGTWTETQQAAARVCKGTDVTATDAMWILQRAVGLISSFDNAK